jgi:hypothetical protein
VSATTTEISSTPPPSVSFEGRSDGTKWNSEQLLFHMVFGYLLVRNLRMLVWVFSRLPVGASRRFVELLNGATRPLGVDFQSDATIALLVPRPCRPDAVYHGGPRLGPAG